MRKISELPVTTRLPENDELVLPVCKDETAHVVRQISVKALAEAVKVAVIESGDVEMEVTERGIKFKQV